MPAATVKFYIDITIGRSGQKWDFRLNFWPRGPIDTRSTCLNRILQDFFRDIPFEHIWHAQICTPNIISGIFGCWFFCGLLWHILTPSKEKKGKNKLGLHTYCAPSRYYSWWIIQGLCSPPETRTGGVLYDPDSCCKNRSPYKRSVACPHVKKALIKRGQSYGMLLKARQRAKSL